MNHICKKWKDAMSETALTGARPPEFAEHLQTCAGCAAELKKLEAHKVQMDLLLPLLAQGSELSPNFRTNVLAAARATDEKRHPQPWKFAVLAGALVAVALLVVAVSLRRQTSSLVTTSDLAVAQKLAEWRAPSDAFLATPGQELLRTMPKLGQSYLSVPVKKQEEE